MTGDREMVFGYGSLLSRSARGHASQRARIAHLTGFRRAWNIAMDNTVDLPSYKHYRDHTGHRPPVFVTFLNLVPAPGHRVNGVLIEVTGDELAQLDARERNYARIDVTGHMADAPAGRVWTYVGSVSARTRYETGLAAGRAVVSRAYYDGVLRGFASLGEEAVAEYTATTDPPACPICELARIDLPS